jgi:hypothetical protein
VKDETLHFSTPSDIRLPTSDFCLLTRLSLLSLAEYFLAFFFLHGCLCFVREMPYFAMHGKLTTRSGTA